MLFSFSAVLALTATLAAAGPLSSRSQGNWDFPTSMPLAVRQELPDPGTPLYNCHENCGLSITYSREEGYCTNWQWISRFDACLICANEFDIWRYYSNSVTAAAEACGLEAVPARI